VFLYRELENALNGKVGGEHALNGHIKIFKNHKYSLER
jgi:hypothetical protein